MKKTWLVITLTIIALASVPVVYFGLQELYKIQSDDPTVWETDIQALEIKTRSENPSDNAVLFVGSSSIRFWDTLKQDMAPLPVIQHGFGGAKIHDVVFYAERLITQWQASKVVIFVGSNDINGNEEHHMAPAHIGEQLRQLFDIIFTANPNSEIFYISITPTPFSWDKWNSVQEANRIVSEVCDKYDNATFINTVDMFLNEQGEPNKELFVIDGLHLNEKGYALWTQRIKPYLMHK